MPAQAAGKNSSEQAELCVKLQASSSELADDEKTYVVTCLADISTDKAAGDESDTACLKFTAPTGAGEKPGDNNPNVQKGCEHRLEDDAQRPAADTKGTTGAAGAERPVLGIKPDSAPVVPPKELCPAFSI